MEIRRERDGNKEREREGKSEGEMEQEGNRESHSSYKVDSQVLYSTSEI